MQLDDKYTLEAGRAYLTGIQALVRLPMDQMRLDRRAGLRTGAFITGYEGSPLGGYDFALARAAKHLSALDIHFRPGMNEDLAATAVYGTQMLSVAGPARVDGVVGIWYGKGPGVDRSGDALRHANLAGSPGVSAALVLAGDDHPCKSSSIPHQSDFSLYNVNIPILYPGNTQEILDYGLYAIALSRYSGAWTSLKLLTQTCDGGGTVDLDLDRHRFQIPDGYRKFHDARLVPGIALGLERETNLRRMEAVLEFLRRNPVNRLTGARDGARLGIATAGKSYYDLMQALADLGIAGELDRLGIRIAKFGATYPLERGFVTGFARGLSSVLVVEEKRSFLELQLREALYDLPDRPPLTGKSLLSSVGELNPDSIALALAAWLEPHHPALPSVAARVAELKRCDEAPRELAVLRTPNYCPGCPHNRSTMVLDGQVAGGGIGCHGMGFLLEDAGRGYSWAGQMGGEGAAWFGMAPFSERGHVFQNMGDGTYFHSGSLAIQAAVAAGVNITYKILYNGHVAMTGGQDAVGALPVPDLTKKLSAEGVRRIVIVAEFPERYSDPGTLAMNASVRPRADLEAVLRELEGESGVTVLIYDQECAAEKRRQRSRGKLADPARRVMIHERLCEGCGDCVVKSNCSSLVPVETAYGQKMSVHQASCNKDYSCTLGDCPSFLAVEIMPGSGLRTSGPVPVRDALLPEPVFTASLDRPYRILAPGIGGTGVVTINALLAAAASIEGLHVLTLDQTGLAQKGGAVVSHLVLSRDPLESPPRINTGNSDLVLGFDLLGVLSPDNLRTTHAERTAAVVNTDLTPTAESVRKRLDLAAAGAGIDKVARATRRGHNVYVDASRLSERYFGSHLFTNMIVLGAAWQAGLVPLRRASIDQAIALNGVSVEKNRKAFEAGRQAAAGLLPADAPPTPRSQPDYKAELEAYQGAAWAREWAEFVQRVESERPDLAPAVALHLFRLMTYKDEYEVARLLTGSGLQQQVAQTWAKPGKVSFLLHPPVLRAFGVNRKLRLGPWIRPLLSLLASLKFLRGSALDVFGWTAHRRRERALIAWYRGLVEAAITTEDAALAQALVEIPASIRGFETVKDRSIAEARKKAGDLLSARKAGIPAPGVSI